LKKKEFKGGDVEENLEEWTREIIIKSVFLREDDFVLFNFEVLSFSSQ